MKKTSLILSVLFSVAYTISYGQEVNLSKFKKAKLKQTKYIISIPRTFQIATTDGIDFIGYSISDTKVKSIINSPHLWLYLGYFPKSMVDDKYKLIDSSAYSMLNDTIFFKTYRSDQGFLVEGSLIDNTHKIPTQIVFERPLKLYIWMKAKDYNGIELMIKILQTLELR
jgi:hypothetical protein